MRNRLKNLQNKKKKILNLIFISVYLISALVMIFTRSFIGLNFYGYRLGEILVLLGLIVSLFLTINFKKLSFINVDIFNNYFKSIILSFFIVVLLTGSNISNSYAFKSSSYIWTIGFLIIGIFFTEHINNVDKRLVMTLSFIPLIIYIFNTGNYPDFIINFFLKYSDKFQFIKASDIFLAVITIYFYLEKLRIKQKLKILYLFIYIPLFLPMLIIQSRGSYVGIIIFSLLVIFYEKEYLLKNKKTIFFYLIISSIIFIISSFRVSGVDFFETELTPELVTEQVKTNSEVKDTKKAFLTFYINDGRLFSKDETTNWRLDIWQDVAFDMYQEGNILYGYGYKSIIPQMVDPSAPGRLGRDGLNENVHNYFVTVLSRGGLIQVALFLLFHISMIQIWKKNEDNYKILIYYLPVLFVSCLDISMDGVQFPLIFFGSLGYFLNELKSNK
jgi:hypothetical protein